MGSGTHRPQGGRVRFLSEKWLKIIDKKRGKNLNSEVVLVVPAEDL